MKELDDLRYPIGRFSPPTSGAPGIRAAQIQTLRLLPERLRAAVAGLNDPQLDTPYREGGWTVRQVAHHLADSRLPIGVSLALVDALHARWVALLEAFTDEDFQKGYNHPEDGRVSLAGQLAMYEWHSRHHTAHITTLRTRMGW